MLIFDIETGPLPLDQLRSMMPAHPEFVEPGEFDPASVKLGNTKDPDKVKEKIELARAAHTWEKTHAREKYDQDKAAAEAAFIDKASLSAVTGRVLAIGYYSAEKRTSHISADDDECTVLAFFWNQFKRMTTASPSRNLVGFNSNSFDVPFLLRRSWILGVDVPANVRNGRYLNSHLVDLREVWLCGQRWNDCESNLDHVARALGVGAKTEGVSGKDFAKLFATDRVKAEEYLMNDLDMTYRVACRLGVC